MRCAPPTIPIQTTLQASRMKHTDMLASAKGGTPNEVETSARSDRTFATHSTAFVHATIAWGIAGLAWLRVTMALLPFWRYPCGFSAAAWAAWPSIRRSAACNGLGRMERTMMQMTQMGEIEEEQKEEGRG